MTTTTFSRQMEASIASKIMDILKGSEKFTDLTIVSLHRAGSMYSVLVRTESGESLIFDLGTTVKEIADRYRDFARMAELTTQLARQTAPPTEYTVTGYTVVATFEDGKQVETEADSDQGLGLLLAGLFCDPTVIRVAVAEAHIGGWEMTRKAGIWAN